jgi:2,3-bisphosphoglycerate-independent phosphoglycerate mutase
MKQLLLIIDGMADLPCAALDGRTPLEAAHTPHLDSMTSLGSISTTPPGFATDSQNCILSLLGLPPEHIPRGRAYLEAVAADLPLEEDDLLLRLNFVGVEQGRVVRNCLPFDEPLPELEGLHFLPTSPGRGLLRLPGQAAFHPELVCHAPHENMGAPIEALMPSGGGPAQMLANAALSLLARTGGTVSFIVWAPSVRAILPTFRTLRGMTGGVVTGTPVVEGMALAMDMALPRVEGATGDTDARLDAKLDAALSLLPGYDFVLLHLNGADEAGHRRDAQVKADFLSRVDREVIGPLLKAGLDRSLVVLSDHATVCETGGHHPMPVEVWGFSPAGNLPEIRTLLPATVRPI